MEDDTKTSMFGYALGVVMSFSAAVSYELGYGDGPITRFFKNATAPDVVIKDHNPEDFSPESAELIRSGVDLSAPAVPAFIGMTPEEVEAIVSKAREPMFEFPDEDAEILEL